LLLASSYTSRFFPLLDTVACPQVLANLDVLIEVGQACLASEQRRRALAPRALRPTVLGADLLAGPGTFDDALAAADPTCDSDGGSGGHGGSRGGAALVAAPELRGLSQSAPVRPRNPSAPGSSYGSGGYGAATAAQLSAVDRHNLEANLKALGDDLPSYLAFRPSDNAKEQAALAYPFPGSRRS
jgi:hypothetical protein